VIHINIFSPSISTSRKYMLTSWVLTKSIILRFNNMIFIEQKKANIFLTDGFSYIYTQTNELIYLLMKNTCSKIIFVWKSLFLNISIHFNKKKFLFHIKKRVVDEEQNHIFFFVICGM